MAMKFDDLQEGQRVRIICDAEVGPLTHHGDGALLQAVVRLGSDSPERLTITRELARHLTLECVRPAEWPPQPGDLWQDPTGRVWFFYHNARRHYGMAAREADGEFCCDKELADLLAQPLVLVRR